MRSWGFSLIELMVTVAVLAILVAIGLPSFQSSMRSNRLATASNELIASFSLARSEAIRSPGGAAICSSADGTSCGGTWNDGWMVWIDADGDGLTTGVDDRVVRYVEGKAQLNVTMETTDDATLVRFDPHGRRMGAERVITIEPAECPIGHDLVRELSVSATGQINLVKDECE